MLFSIIVPVYNVQAYLNECVDNILKQSFSDYELILVDDGSTDNSGALCDEYAQRDSRVTVIHQVNRGVSCARNAGTAIARGEYIVYLDSDDYFTHADVLSTLAEKSKGKADVILYGYRKYFEKSQTYGKEINNYPSIDPQEAPASVIRKLLQQDMYEGSAWSKAVKRSLLEENQIAFVPGMISEDSDWYLQVVQCAKTYEAINEAFVAYRQREGSISHAPKLKSLTDNIGLLNRWSAHVQQQVSDPELSEALMAVLARYYGNLLILYTAFPQKVAKEYADQVKELKYLLAYSVTPRAKTIAAVVRVLGLPITIQLLRLAKKIR